MSYKHDAHVGFNWVDMRDPLDTARHRKGGYTGNDPAEVRRLSLLAIKILKWYQVDTLLYRGTSGCQYAWAICALCPEFQTIQSRKAGSHSRHTLGYRAAGRVAFIDDFISSGDTFCKARADMRGFAPNARIVVILSFDEGSRAGSYPRHYKFNIAEWRLQGKDVFSDWSNGKRPPRPRTGRGSHLLRLKSPSRSRSTASRGLSGAPAPRPPARQSQSKPATQQSTPQVQLERCSAQSLGRSERPQQQSLLQQMIQSAQPVQPSELRPSLRQWWSAAKCLPLPPVARSLPATPLHAPHLRLQVQLGQELSGQPKTRWDLLRGRSGYSDLPAAAPISTGTPQTASIAVGHQLVLLSSFDRPPGPQSGQIPR